MLNEEIIEKFIRENRDKFRTYDPPVTHTNKFLMKHRMRLRHVISIVPYLIRVAIVTTIVFTASVIVWDNYIRKDRHDISLGNKITLVVGKMKPDGHNKSVPAEESGGN